jgi:hypothetical protein
MHQLNYFPIIKLKEQELNHLACLNNDLKQKDIIPYFEFLRDPFGPSNTRLKKKKSTATTLEAIEGALPDGKEFVGDIYHFDDKVRNNCGKEFLISNKNTETYYTSMLELAKFGLCIPCFLVQNEDAAREASRFADAVHKMGKRCAVRSITFKEETLKIIFNSLGQDDLFFLDIGTKTIATSVPTFSAVFEIEHSCHIIPLYRNRTSRLKLEEFKNDTYESKNIVPDQFETIRDNDFVFYGFSDYCGQKDDLNTGGNGRGYVKTAFIYSFRKKGFYIIQDRPGKNDFGNIKKTLFDKRGELDPLGFCPAYKLVTDHYQKTMGFWWMVCLVRYVNQINQEINE